jgi:hypothetical protein
MTPEQMFEEIMTWDCPSVVEGEYEIHVLNLHCQFAIIVRKVTVQKAETVYFKIEYDEYETSVNEIVAKIKEGSFPA